MIRFFIEGGWGMYPVLVMGLILVGASIRFSVDMEPVRLRFITVLSLALAVTMLHATLTCVVAVLEYMKRHPENVTRTLLTGLLESTRTASLGGAFLSIALVLVSVGFYRSGRRELIALSKK